MTNEGWNRIERLLWPKGFSRDAWMITDAASDPRIYGLLLDCFYSLHTCLFSGEIAAELRVAAPYLVQLEFESQKTRRFISQAWGRNWGVFLKCDARLETLRRHLRSCILATDEKGNRLLFRYYDPRVMRVYLPTCTTAELAAIYGPIDRFLVENKTGDAIVDYSFNGRRLEETEYALPAEANASVR